MILVGAGPAGAALAYLLARRGVEVVLLERQTDFAREFRGEVLLPGGLEALDQMGLAGERELRADLVVGADGRSSVVRRRGSLHEVRDATPMDVVWCKLPLPEWGRREPLLRGYLGGGHLLLAGPSTTAASRSPG